MKRNLSSQAIRAMAIGMAVTLGSATAISGVVTGTVVNVYAANTHNANIKSDNVTIEKDGSDAKIILTRANDSNTSFGGTAKKTSGFILKKGSETIFTGDTSKGEVTVEAATITIKIPLSELSGKLVGNENNLSISYTKTSNGGDDIKINTTNANFQDGSSVSLEIEGISISNSIDTTAPTLSSATYSNVNSTPTVEVTLTEELADRNEQEDESKFTIAKKDQGTDGVKVTKYKSENGKLVLTLDQELADGTYTVTYAQEDLEIKDKAGNKLATNGKVEVTVKNKPQDQIAPELTSDNPVYDETNKTITLTANEELQAYDESNALNQKFTVKKNNVDAQEITNVKVDAVKDATKIVITLKNQLEDGSYTIGYNGDIIKDKAGNKLVQNENLKTLIVGIDNNNLIATTNVGTYTFKDLSGGKVALIEFKAGKLRNIQDNKFENGVLTIKDKTYTLTEIGDGKKAVYGLTTAALEGHTINVTEIKGKAFENNDKVTKLSFPKVTNVGASAFSGASALTTIDLGSQVAKTEIAEDAFKDAKAITTVKTNEASKITIETAAKKGNSSVKVEVSISKDKYNAKDAKIEKDKLYITEDGLLFKGLNEKDLTFMGKKEFKAPTQANTLNGSEGKEYFVTYENGEVILKSEQTSEGPSVPPVDEATFTAELGSNKMGTFEKVENKTNEVALITISDKTRDAQATQGILDNGVLTIDKNTYNLTVLGNGTDSLGNFENTVLEGNLNNVTTVKSNAFKDNTTIKTITLPVVEKIEDNAFTGAISLTTIDLGKNDINITANTFIGVGTSNSKTTIKTNSDKTLNSIKQNGGNTVQAENPAPEVLSAEVTKEESKYVLTLTLSENVFSNPKTTHDKFTVKSGNENSLQVNNVTDVVMADNKDKANNTIKLNLTNPVYKGEKITIAYNDNSIKDASAEEKTLVKFEDTKLSVVNKVEEIKTEKVTISEAVVDGNTVTLTSSNLKNVTLKTVNGFKITKGENQDVVTVNKVTITGDKTIILTLDTAITEQDKEIKFAYDGTNTEFVTNKDIKIGVIDAIYVVNKKDNIVPTLTTGTFTKDSSSGGTITLNASEPLAISNFTSDTGFTVNKDSSGACTITKVEVKKGNQKQLLITVSDDLTSVNKLKVTYNKPSTNKITDLNKQELANISSEIVTTPAVARGIAHRDDDFAVIALAADKVKVVNGDVTGITSVKDATEEQINSILKGGKLTNIYNGAFKDVDKDLTLDFSKVNISNLNIERGAFSGAKGLNITGVNSSNTEKLAEMIGSSSDIKINGKTTQDIIKDNSNSGNGGSGSGGGSSSGGSGGGSGANIGTITNKKPNTEETTSQGNKNETVVENKQLSFDVIKLPSVEGEAKVFGDVSANHWAKSYIDKLSTARIINGSNGMFNPNGQTKRADVTVMLVNLLGLTPEANNKFADVNASAYYAPYVGTASTYGIVNGSNGMFNPQGVISRQDTMVMIAQILKGLNLNVNADTTALSQFGDGSKVSAYANESVAILVNSGIISGNNGKLNPTAPVTRAEMATIMSKLYDVLASANK